MIDVFVAAIEPTERRDQVRRITLVDVVRCEQSQSLAIPAHHAGYVGADQHDMTDSLHLRRPALLTKPLADAPPRRAIIELHAPHRKRSGAGDSVHDFDGSSERVTKSNALPAARAIQRLDA